jgi:hypothetical protein
MDLRSLIDPQLIIIYDRIFNPRDQSQRERINDILKTAENYKAIYVMRRLVYTETDKLCYTQYSLGREIQEMAMNNGVKYKKVPSKKNRFRISKRA